MNIDLINDVGSATKSRTTHENTMTLNDHHTNEDLSSLFTKLSVQAHNIANDGGGSVLALQDSILSDTEATKSDELHEIISKWVTIEDDAEVKQDDVEEYIEMLESNCSGCADSGKGEDIQSNDKDVVMMEPDEDKVSWKDTVDAMQTIRKYVEQETLGDETEAKLDKLIFDIQKKKVGKRIKQSTCQDSIMKYFTKE